MARGLRKSLRVQSSRPGRLMYVPLGLAGIASVIVLLAMQAGLVGAIAGVTLVGLSSFMTTCLVKHYPEQQVTLGTVVPPTPGWLKLITVCVEIWMDVTGQTNASAQIHDSPTMTASQRAIAMLQAVPGMTTAHARDFKRSEPFARLQDGTVVKRWKNPVGVEHVFLADDEDRMLYGGFVGWVHTPGLQQTVAQIKRELT